MLNYKIVTPEKYSIEHHDFIDEVKDKIRILSTQTQIMLILKDADSRIITGSDVSARTFGLKSGREFDGKFFADLPCKAVAAYEEQIKQHDRQVINSKDINKKLQVLNVYQYYDGLKARLTTQNVFYHKNTQSILGVLNTANTVQLKDFINIIPSYILQFGALGSIEAISGTTEPLTNGVGLTEYEQEVCFLLLLNWSFTQIAEFMNRFRPNQVPRNANTIIKKKDSLCNKFNLPSHTVSSLCEYLFSIGFHQKMPLSFYSRITGSHIID